MSTQPLDFPAVAFKAVGVKDARQGIWYAAIEAVVYGEPAMTYVFTTRRYTDQPGAARYAATLLKSMREGLLADAMELPGQVEMVALFGPAEPPPTPVRKGDA